MDNIDQKSEPTSRKSNRSPDLTKALVTGAAALVFLLGLRFIAQDLITPILLSTFVAVLIFPIFKIFRRMGLHKYISLVLMILTIILMFVLFGLFLTYTFSSLSESLDQYVGNITETIRDTLQVADDYIEVEELSTEVIAEQVPNVLTEDRILSFARTILGSLGNIFYLFFFIPFIAIIMMLQFDSMPKTISDELADQSPMVRRFQKFAKSITVYIIGRGKVNLFTGALFAIALALIGVDYPILWGILVAVLSFIPYVGIVIASIPPVLLALAEGGWFDATLVIISVTIVNVIAENVLDPYVQGQSNKITALTVILALIFWTWLLGPVGGLLSVPLTVLLKLILEDFEETKWIALIMEGNFEAGSEEAKKQGLMERLTSRFTRK